jgi:twitching motility protein PilJ
MSADKKKAANAAEPRTGNSAVAGLFIFFIVIMIANFGYNLYQSPADDQRINLAEELQVLSQQISNNATESVAGGNVDAFQFLANTRNSYETNITELQKSLLEFDFKLTSPEPVRRALRDTGEVWSKVRDNADTILQYRDETLDLHDVALQLSRTIPKLQEDYQEVVMLMVANGAQSSQVSLATNQIWLAERISANVRRILAGDLDATQGAEVFRQDVLTFGQVVQGMLDGNSQANISRINTSSIRAVLNRIATSFSSVQNQSSRIIQSISDLSRAHAAADEIFAEAGNLLKVSESLSNAFNDAASNRIPGNPKLSGVLLLIVLILLFVMYGQQRKKEREQIALSEALANKEKEQNERNQEAIIRLLDEMEGLADGDLTSHATVTEDFTGAIADAMNYTIDQLRSLVSAINRTVVQVSQSTDTTRASAAEMAQASRNQAQEIVAASAAISDMAESIEGVSKNAIETTEMAQESVAIAKNGGDTVRNTIRAMDNIREQIQETSKRIKRLGESSQEIGDIVALINDISDQTNILALNAAIQATMAGEAGRGFAVVSDEVQRLAERSGNAAKQIEGLVKTIQNDTNQAVISMESSTSEVVNGARLAQDAGVALERIEKVSNDVAGLITNISETARQQAASAINVSKTMNVIQDITTNTAAGTEKTAGSIGDLADLAEELKGSVAGFKLPD